MTLLQEIARGENVALEFKEARPKDSLKFTKTVVAFSNGRGGRILFGVENATGRIVGVPREKVSAEMDAIVDAIANSCTPHISVDVKPTVVDGKALIAVDVKSGEKTPYYVRGLGIRKGTFVRVGATSRQAEEHVLKGLILMGENLSFDKQEVPGVKLTAKSIEEASAMMTAIARRNCKTDAERKAIHAMTGQRLVSMGLLKRKGAKWTPTYGFCVVTGLSAPDILAPRIKCGVFRGNQKGDFIDRHTCEGGIVSQIDEAYKFLLKNLKVGSEIVGTGLRNVYELPIDALREAICNAVFHRDYLTPSCVYVAVFDDRVEITSPGELVRDMTLEDARDGFSKLRNHAIGAALEYMGEVEGWGGGVQRYFSSCAEMGLEMPTLVEDGGCLKVTFYRRKDVVKSVEKGKEKSKEKGKEKSKEKILAFIAQHPECTVDNLARKIGLSRSGIEKNIRLLKQSGLLQRSGGDRGGRWIVCL